jgi:two-component system, NtrC family, response regulator AtoC
MENRNLERPTLGIHYSSKSLAENRELISLLVVSRDSSVLRLLWPLEESNPWRVDTAASGWDAMERLQSADVPRLLLLDVPRADSDGFHFLRWARRLHRDLPVVILCHPEEAAQAKEELSNGRGEVLIRPFDAGQLESVIRRQFEPAVEAEEHMVSSMVTKEVDPLGQDAVFVGASLVMQKLQAQAALMAKTDAPVLILGERGSGKFTVAGLIHGLSVRSGFRLRRLNCAQMPEPVLESELDGGRTAGGERSGTLVSGEKGTIFLDEITALSQPLQARLLQILQNHEVQNPTGRNGMPAPVRILAASSINVERALAEKWLREDLYYRLSAFTVHVPPVRQRKDEIPTLLRYFMHKLAKHYSLPPRTYSAAVLDACQRYSWPGNLKEMEIFVKRYLVAGDQGSWLREMPAAIVPEDDGTMQKSAWAAETADAEETAIDSREPRPESLKSMIQNIKSEAEKNAIGAALKTTGWNRKAAARMLRVSYRTLLYKIEQYQMRAPEPFLSSFRSEELLSCEEVKGNGKAS